MSKETKETKRKAVKLPVKKIRERAASEVAAVATRERWDVSAHRIRIFERCPRQHRHRYVDKWKPESNARGYGPAQIGNAIHAAIEGALLARLNDHRSGAAGEVPADELQLRLREAAARYGLGVKGLRDAREIVDTFAPLAHGRILAVEAPWTVEIELVGPDVVRSFTVGGRLDLLHEVTDEHTGAPVIEWADWKTGQGVMDGDEVDEDPQVLTYQIGLGAVTDDADERERRVRLHYLAKSEKRTVWWTPDVERGARDLVISCWQAWTRGHDEPRIGMWCADCDFSGRCEPFRRAVSEENRPKDGVVLSSLSTDDLAVERDRLKVLASLAEARRQSYDEELDKRLRMAGTSKLDLHGVGLRVSRRSRKSSEVDMSVVRAAAEAIGRDPLDLALAVCKVSSPKITAAVKGHEKAKEIVERFRSPVTVRWVEVRRVRGPF